MKHHPWGKPRLRLIFANEDLTELYWADPKITTKADSNGKYKGKILTAAIKDVKDGFYKASKSNVKDKLDRCFCIRTKNRVIELEAPTKEAKEKWKHMFE